MTLGHLDETCSGMNVERRKIYCNDQNGPHLISLVRGLIMKKQSIWSTLFCLVISRCENMVICDQVDKNEDRT